MKTQAYQTKIADLFAHYHVSASGLSKEEAARRLEASGPNALPAAKVDSYLKIFARQFASPLIYVLIAAGVIVLLMGEYIDASAVFIVLLFNAVVGAFQEGKAQNTLLALNKFTTTEATVIRSGRELIIPSEEVVLGDIVLLRDGDKVPADVRLFETTNLRINESALTGESTPVLKNEETLAGDDLPPAEQVNLAFKGTLIIAGTGRGLVVGTGLETAVGRISAKLGSLEADVPLKANIKAISRVIIIGVVFINLFLFVVGLLYGNSFIDMFKTVVAVSVALIPEGLPVVITLVLAAGVWRMGKRQALVKRLQAVEALGQAKVIAVDKTGTITKNELMVQSLFTNGQSFDITGDGYSPDGEIRLAGQVLDPPAHPELVLAGRIATFCASAHVAYSPETELWQVAGDPTEAALLVFGQKTGFHREALVAENPSVGEIPFTSDLKYHSTLHRLADGRHFFTQVGAPEIIINRAKYIFRDGERHKITASDKKDLHQQMKAMSARGLRVLAFGYHDEAGPTLTEDDLPELTLVGLFGMSDVIRQEAKEALHRARAAGIKVVMITGDHADTARAIAAEVGLFRPGDEIITGADLETWDDATLDQKLSQTSVFARVTPEHKLRIIDAYRRRKEIIAMTGDGVNDALSLVAADLGVAMGRVGTEVAKEAADIILLDDNFGSIVSAVEEGRNIYQTIKKVVLYLFSTSIAEVLVIIGAILLGWPLPLAASQIIWLNVITDSFLVVALAVDPKDGTLLAKPFVKPNRWFFDSLMIVRTVVMTTVMTVGSLLAFWYYLPDALVPTAGQLAYASTIVLSVLVFYQWMNIWNCRSEDRSIFKMKIWENKYLLFAAILVIGLQLAAIYLPPFQTFLRTVPLSIFDWLLVILISLSIIIVEEIRKLFARKLNT
ncbi:MAG: HAD-IC family P-type ATPase [Candidatus Paceibacterota bacterium]